MRAKFYSSRSSQADHLRLGEREAAEQRITASRARAPRADTTECFVRTPRASRYVGGL
jgi:hypothetical protein